jgi:hypothetical protein
LNVEKETSAGGVDEIEDVSKSVLASGPRIGYLAIPWVISSQGRIELPKQPDARVVVRGTAVEYVASIRVIHGQDEVIELGISGKKCTGSRGEFDPASTCLATGPLVGGFSTVPSGGTGAVHLDPIGKSRFINKRTHDSLGRWRTTDVSKTDKAHSKRFR